jgi:uncharacterized protein
MTTADSPPFTEADLDRLEELLDLPVFGGEAMLLDELQALFCAIISSPQSLTPDDWLPIVFGDEVNFESEAQAAEVIELLVRFYNDLTDRLEDGEDFELILYPAGDDPEVFDYVTWADAYLYGSQLACNWYEAVGDHAEELTELLQPLFLLSGMLREDAQQRGDSWMAPALEQQAIESAQDSLPDLVCTIYAFWRAKLDSDQAIAHDTHKKGGPSFTAPDALDDTLPASGDDPCPCGSGRSFKQCCGSPAKLH